MAERNQVRRLWDPRLLDDLREISHSGALMLLALDDVKQRRDVTPDFCVKVWRRYCASNLTDLEWQRCAWDRQDCGANGVRTLTELAKVGVARNGRVDPTAHHFIARLRTEYAEAMPVPEFVKFCINTYERVTGKID